MPFGRTNSSGLRREDGSPCDFAAQLSTGHFFFWTTFWTSASLLWSSFILFFMGTFWVPFFFWEAFFSGLPAWKQGVFISRRTATAFFTVSDLGSGKGDKEKVRRMLFFLSFISAFGFGLVRLSVEQGPFSHGLCFSLLRSTSLFSLHGKDTEEHQASGVCLSLDFCVFSYHDAREDIQWVKQAKGPRGQTNRGRIFLFFLWNGQYQLLFHLCRVVVNRQIELNSDKRKS